MITKTQSYFLDYPAEAKVWIFMAERSLTQVESDVANSYLTQFVPQWKAHGDALKAGYELIDNQFIVVAVDETPAAASGCSIDSMTRIIKEIEQKTGVTFTDRMLIGYRENETIQTEKLPNFKAKVKSGEIGPETIIYNNSVTRLNDFWDSWEQPLQNSWAKNWI
ncbi:MAG: hypothetical protein Q4G27_07050 [Flavobacteriaceae bacterium]|nr:hypothetical protein [Flavobacteriaceae bacterium]